MRFVACMIFIGLVIGTSPMIFAMSLSAVSPAVTPSPSATATGTPVPSTLPVESSLFAILDDPLSSANAKMGMSVNAHLRDALILNGVTLAPAGTAMTLIVSAAAPAKIGGIDGSIDFYFKPLDLGRYGALPIRAALSHVAIERSAGRAATRDTLDTAGDIFIPGYVLFHALRKGQNVVLPAGTAIRARTTASIDAADAQDVVIATPAPLRLSGDRPFSPFTPLPLFTERPTVPQRSPSPSPSPSPSAAPTST